MFWVPVNTQARAILRVCERLYFYFYFRWRKFYLNHLIHAYYGLIEILTLLNAPVVNCKIFLKIVNWWMLVAWFVWKKPVHQEPGFRLILQCWDWDLAFPLACVLQAHSYQIGLWFYDKKRKKNNKKFINERVWGNLCHRVQPNCLKIAQQKSSVQFVRVTIWRITNVNNALRRVMWCAGGAASRFPLVMATRTSHY